MENMKGLWPSSGEIAEGICALFPSSREVRCLCEQCRFYFLERGVAEVCLFLASIENMAEQYGSLCETDPLYLGVKVSF